MNKTLKIVLIVGGVLLLCGCLTVGGLFTLRVGGLLAGNSSPFNPLRLFGTQSGSFSGTHSIFPGQLLPGSGFDGVNPRPGLLGRLRWLLPFRFGGESGLADIYSQLPWNASPFEYQQGQYYGEVRAWPGMFSGKTGSSASAASISVEQARAAALAYLNGLGFANLEPGEVILFARHAYVEILEKDSGNGAFQVLVDPASLEVGMEPGPSVTWNRKYLLVPGTRADFQVVQEDAPQDMVVSPEQARLAAEEFIQVILPGAEIAPEARPFYGYYTFHVLQNGELAGLVSVDGSSRQVMPHLWNGPVLETGGE